MTQDELRQAIRNLPPLPDTAPEFSWLGRRIELRRRILTEPDLTRFREWPVINATMNGDPDWQNYHLDQWEQNTREKVATVGSIVEFGGGYGAMAEILRRRGFVGDYYSYDFPEFVALQRFYTGLPILTDLPPVCDLMIAICSLSEADLETRADFLKMKYRHCLIRYQHQWGMDNHSYFMSIPGRRWYDTIDPNHWYLVR